MPQFFLKRPVLSIVLSILIVLFGFGALRKLPVEQFPPITPVQIRVTTNLPGASAETMAQSVAAPLEKAINGVENMIYMQSQSAAPGILNLIVSFKVGTNPAKALTDVQNRVNLSIPSLPIEVQRQGIIVTNQYPNILLFVAIESPEGTHDDIFISNYANTNIANQIDRLVGVSEARVVNARDYSMRIWIKPDRLAQFNLTPTDIVAAVREQNKTRSIGLIGGEPNYENTQLTIPVNSLGRLKTPEEFENIILRANRDGSMVLLKDVSRIELGARTYDLVGNLNGRSGAFIAVYQDFGANAIEVSEKVRKKLEELSEFFPEGLSYKIPYDTTQYIDISIWQLEKTLVEAAILVSLVIILFLQSVRASIIPVIAMIVSITGTFIGMYLLGFSVNILSLFGLVLSVGIVVDDAIVVVENTERKIREENLSSKEAAQASMKELTGPIIAITCVLAAVFLPVSFIGGIPGEFYKQFAITIAFSVFLSGFVALSLSPVLSAGLLNKPPIKKRLTEAFLRLFFFLREAYLKSAEWVIEKKLFTPVFFLGMLLAIFALTKAIPLGFVPKEDQGIFMAAASLPDGASLNRVEKVSRQVEQIVMNNKEVSEILSISGYSLLDSISRIQRGAYFINLHPWEDRGKSAFELIDKLNREFTSITEGSITAFNPPDIPGINVIGGFDFWIVNDSGLSYQTLDEVVEKIAEKARKRPEFQKIITSIDADAMELYVDLDKAKTRSLGVRVDQVYEALQTLLGSLYINQFNKYGHIYQVVAQAEPIFRDTLDDIGDVYVRSNTDKMIPLKSLINLKFSKGPTLYQRFNGSPAALISVIPAISNSGKIISVMESIAKEFLPPEISYSWGGIAFEEKETGGISYLPILGSFLLIFLILAALYESWILPISILMAAPFAVFGALLAVFITGGKIDIYFQVGIVALIGLSAKNSILIVEFAKEKRKEGLSLKEASLEAAKTRFRAVVMTSLTMIAGALPLVITFGAGAAGRKSVGTGVIGGMLMATFLALLFVPVFFIATETLSEKGENKGE